jgi:hypothetical protein
MSSWSSATRTSGRAGACFDSVVSLKLLNEVVTIFGKTTFSHNGRAAPIGKVRGENKDYPYGDGDTPNHQKGTKSSFASKVSNQ